MKERIVIDNEEIKEFKEREKEFYDHLLQSGGAENWGARWWKYKIEKQPETFEDVRKLLNDKLVEMGVPFVPKKEEDLLSIKEEFWCKGILFSSNKTLSVMVGDKICTFMYGVSFPLMWNIIQNLIEGNKND